jgi:hypothetical protein
VREVTQRLGPFARRNKWWLLLVAMLVAIGATIATTVAIQEGGEFLGTTAAGSHQWWQDFDNNAGFCERCHIGIAAELAAGPHASAGLSDCTFCHGATANDEHAASTAKCAQCHPGVAADLTTGDAHVGMTVDLGETTPGEVSWTCKACHTHVEVNLTAEPRGPLELIMGN